MKKRIFIFVCLSFGILSILSAQIPNPGFESWTSGDPDGWASSNTPAAGLVNVTQSTDMHSGAYALQGTVVNFFDTPMGPVIQSGPGGHGFPISEQYHYFILYYKFSPVGGDRFAVNVGFTKNGAYIANGAVALPAAVDSYTKLSVPMTYTLSETPDTAIIQIQINGPVTGTDYHVGSVMLVDDLSFSLSTGTEQEKIPLATGNCFPNPSSDLIKIPVSGISKGFMNISVFDIAGKKVKEVQGVPVDQGNQTIQISIRDLNPGMYSFSVFGEQKNFSGRFGVAR